MVSRRLRVGKNCRPRILLAVPDLRWPDDLQLHPDQPVPGLSKAVSAPLSGWLAGKGYARGHAVWTSLRKCSGCVFPAEDSAAALFREWSVFRDQALQYSKADGWDRMLQQGVQLLDRFSGRQ